MPYNIRLPRSGRIIPFPDDVDKEEARLAVIDRFPEEFPYYKPDEGFIPGLKSGWETLKGVPSAMQAGIGGLSGDQQQFEAGIKGLDAAEKARRQALPQPITFFEQEGRDGPSIEKTYEEEGFIPAASQATTFWGQELGRQIPQMGAAYGANILGRGPGAKLVSGVLGKALPALRVGATLAPHPLLKLALGTVAGIGTMAAQSFAEMVAADRAEGAATPEEFEFARKALYAGPIGAMDYIFVGLTSPAGSSIRNAAEKTLRRTIGEKAVAAGSEFVTETLQEVLFRAERGEDLSPWATEQAKLEFLELMASVAPTALTFAGGSAAYDRIDAARSRRIFDKATELEKQKREEKESLRSRTIAEDEARATAEAEQELEARNRWIDNVTGQIDQEVEAFGETLAPTHKDITDLANSKNINWDNNEAFMAFTHRKSDGEAVHLDQLDPAENDDQETLDRKERHRRKIYSVLERMQKQEKKSDLSMFSEADYRRAVEGIRNSSKEKRQNIADEGGWIVRESLDPLFKSQKDKDSNRIGNKVAQSIIKEMERRGDAERISVRDRPKKKGEKGKLRRPVRFIDKEYTEDEYVSVLSEAQRRGLLTEDAVTAALRPRNRSYDPSLYRKILADARKRGDVDKRTRRVIPTSARTLAGRQGSQIVASGPVVEEVERGWIVTKDGERDRGFTTRGSKTAKNEGTSRGYIAAREAEGKTGYRENKVGLKGFAVIDEGNLEDGTPYREVLDFFEDEQSAINKAELISQGRMNIPNPLVERVQQEKEEKKNLLWKQLRDIPGYAEYLEKKNIDQIKNARSARGSMPLTPEEELRRSAAIQQMKNYLEDIGISDVVSPRIEKVLTEPGDLAEFDPILRKISVALDKVDPNWNATQTREYLREQMDHEILHALVELDLIKENEWNALVKKAFDQKIPAFILKESNDRITSQNAGVTDPKKKIEKFKPDATFADLAAKKYMRPLVPEEAVAEMLRAYGKDKRVLNGRPRNIAEKVYKIFERLSNWSYDLGYVSASDIFDDILDGKVGRRSRDEIRTFHLNPEVTRMAIPRTAGEKREEDLVLDDKPTKADAYDKDSDVPSPSDLDTRKNIQVFKNTEEFNNFFKESVVRDEYGELIPLYHATGTPRLDPIGMKGMISAVREGRDLYDIDSFQPWTHFGTVTAGEDRLRSLVEENIYEGEEFIARMLDLYDKDKSVTREVSRKLRQKGERFYPVYLNITNPLDMDDVGPWHDPVSVLTAISRMIDRGDFLFGQDGQLSKDPEFLRLQELARGTGGVFVDPKTGTALKLEDIQSWLESKGYDGIVYENAQEDPGSASYIIFHPEQAKTLWNMSPTLSKKLLKNTEDFKNAEELNELSDEIEERGHLDMDAARVLKRLGAGMYSNSLPKVATKELFQNAFDGIKSAEKAGVIERGDGKIVVVYNKLDRTIGVLDNGIGMSPSVISDAFFTIGGTDKSNLDPTERSGGFGLAKIGFLLNTDRVRLETVDVDGIKSVVDLSSDEILETLPERGEGVTKTFPIKRSKTSEPPGTKVLVRIPRQIELASGSVSDVPFPEERGVGGAMNQPLIGDVDVKEYYISDETSLSYNDLEERLESVSDGPELITKENDWRGKEFNHTKYPKFTTVNFDWGTADVYIGEDMGELSPWNDPEIKVLSSGLYQFSMGNPWSDTWRGFPFINRHVIVDIKSTEEADSAAYPFENNREGFSPWVKNDILALREYLKQYAFNIKAAEHVRQFGDIKSIDTFESAVDVSDPRVTPQVILDGEHFRNRARDLGGDGHNTAQPSFSPDQNLVDSAASSYMAITQGVPLFHNNTNLDLSESEKSFLRDIAYVSDNFRRDLAVIPIGKDAGRSGVNVDPNAYGHKYSLILKDVPGTEPVEWENYEISSRPRETRNRATDERGIYHVGVSLDKGYKGVHLNIPFNGIFINPLTAKSDNVSGVVGSLVHTLQHEAVHSLTMPATWGTQLSTPRYSDHNQNFVVQISQIIEETAHYGISRKIEDEFAQVLSEHWDTFIELRKRYDSHTTENIGKSIEGDTIPLKPRPAKGVSEGLGGVRSPRQEDERSSPARMGQSPVIREGDVRSRGERSVKKNVEEFVNYANDLGKAGFVYPGQNTSFPHALGNMPLADGESQSFNLISAPAPAVPSAQRFIRTLTPSNYQDVGRDFSDGVDELRNLINGQVNKTGTGVEKVITDILDMGFPSQSKTKGSSSFVFKLLKKANSKLLGTTSLSVKPYPTKTQYQNLGDDLSRIMSDVGSIYASALSSRSDFNAPVTGVSAFLSKYAQDPRFSDSIEEFFPQGMDWNSSSLSTNDRFFHDVSTGYKEMMKNPGSDGVNAQTAFREAFNSPVSSSSAASVYKNFASAISARAFVDELRTKSFKPNQPLYRGGSSAAIRGVEPGNVINISGFGEFTSSVDEAVTYATSEDPSINPVIYRIDEWSPVSMGAFPNIEKENSYFLSGPVKVQSIANEIIGDKEFTVVNGEHLSPEIILGKDFISTKSANVYSPGMSEDVASEVSNRISSGSIARINPMANERSSSIAKGQLEGEKLKPGVKNKYRLNAKQNTSTFLPADRELAAVVRRMSGDPGHRTFGEKVLDVMDWENWFSRKKDEAGKTQLFTRIRAGFLDTWEAASKLDRRVQENFGDRFLYADTSAASQLYLSDRSAGIMESLMTMGYLVYDKGYLHVVPMNVKLDPSDKRYGKSGGYVEGGILEILRPLFQQEGLISKNNLLREWQAYRSLVKEARLSKTTDREGKPVYKYLISDARDRQKAAELLRKYPVFETVNQNYEVWNSHLVKAMVDTGVITPEMGKIWIDFGDYIPFYRQLDGTSDSDLESHISKIFESEYRRKDPTSVNVPKKMFNSIAGAKAPKKIKGGVDPFMDPLEGIAKNAFAAVVAANKNVAAQRLTRNGLLFGDELVVEVPNVKDYPAAVTIRYKGEDRHFVWKDVPLYEIMHGVMNSDIPFMDIVGKPSAWLRAGVTRSPVFIVRNLLRDALSTWITSGFKGNPFTAIIRTLKNFAEGGFTEKELLKRGTPAWKALKGSGVIAGYGFGRDVKDHGKEMHKRLRAIGINPGANNYIAAPVKWMWNAAGGMWNIAGDISTKSDAVSRMSVYEDVLERTGNEAEAVFQALEVINFSRRGNNVAAKFMTAAFPFMNARYQGMDILYRSARGRHGADRSIPKAQMITKILGRASFLTSLTLGYYMMVRDEEWYKGLSDYEKHNNWAIKFDWMDQPFFIPIPFELGIIFKLIPEMILANIYGDKEWDEAWSAISDAFSGTFGGTIMGLPDPGAIQLVKPINEIRTNYSVMTGRDLFPRGWEQKDPRDVYRDNTTQLAKNISEMFGEHGGRYSTPIAIEKVIRGYTGTLGMWTLFGAEYIYMNLFADPKEVRESKRIDQNDFIGSFFGAPVHEDPVFGDVSLGRGYEEGLRELKERTDIFFNRFNSLMEDKRGDEASEFYLEHRDELLNRLIYDRAVRKISELREVQRGLRMLTGFSREQKAQMIQNIDAQINRIARPFSKNNRG